LILLEANIINQTKRSLDMSQISMMCQTIVSVFDKSVGFEQDNDSKKTVGKAVLLVLNDGRKVFQTIIFARDKIVRIYERERVSSAGEYTGWSFVGGQDSPRWVIVLDEYLISKGAHVRFQFDHYAVHGFGSMLVEEITRGFFMSTNRKPHTLVWGSG
jgi:hypothetical protein